MIELTERQEVVFNAIKSNPNIDALKLMVITGYNKNSMIRHLQALRKKNVISRTKLQILYVYKTLDVECVLKKPIERSYIKNKKVDQIEIPEDDDLLHGAMAFELNEEQIKFVKVNKDMPRTQLAKKLGIGKLEMNVALDKLNSKK